MILLLKIYGMQKQKAITQLKISKSKIGLLAVVSAESHNREDFKFD